jgi:hypothetical protein
VSERQDDVTDISGALQCEVLYNEHYVSGKLEKKALN